jgi:hypothetical protein
LPGARQVFVLEIDLVQTSCGMAVPLMSFEGQRDDLNKYNGKQSPDEIEAYWRKKNTQSIDGFPTQIFADEAESHA